MINLRIFGVLVALLLVGLAQPWRLPANLKETDGVTWNPLNITMIDLAGSGSTLGVSFFDPYGNVIPLRDTNGVLWPSVTLVLGASAKVGLSYTLLNTSPDGTHAIAALPANVAIVRAVILSGASNTRTVGWSTGGTPDGSPGLIGNGCNVTLNTSTPDGWFVGDYGQVLK